MARQIRTRELINGPLFRILDAARAWPGRRGTVENDASDARHHQRQHAVNAAGEEAEGQSENEAVPYRARRTKQTHIPEPHPMRMVVQNDCFVLAMGGILLMGLSLPESTAAFA